MASLGGNRVQISISMLDTILLKGVATTMEKNFGRGRREMGSAELGAYFITSSQRRDCCGTNGLPLTPNSILILGRSQYLKSFRHPNLAQYIDIIRGKHERIIVVSEYYTSNLRRVLKGLDSAVDLIPEKILSMSQDILSALAYMNDHGLEARTLSLDNILFNQDGQVKLFNYGLSYMTNGGKYVAFPVGVPKYTAPEIFLSDMKPRGKYIFSCDIWSLGIILIELLLGKEIWRDFKLMDFMQKLATLRDKDSSEILENLFIEHDGSKVLEQMDSRLRRLLEKCLVSDGYRRPCAAAILDDNLIFGPKLCDFSQSVAAKRSCCPKYFFSSNSLSEEDVDELSMREEEKRKTSVELRDFLRERTLQEVYYLWQLAGGDVFAELKRQGLTRKKPAVLSLPLSMTLEGEATGAKKEKGLLLDFTVIVLPLDELHKRLNDLPPEAYFPLILFKIGKEDKCESSSADLPLIIREKDIEYQFHRIVLFDKLLQGYPFTRSLIHKECLHDIPPFFRAPIWTCLLNIQGDVQTIYDSIDKETPTTTDRQIEVDIPRCHQYDELLSSPSGHAKFKRVLKAWVVSNNEYVYWQGLDSLCAPFLFLHFNNEAMAFACLSAFIPKYLYNFFLKDNSAIIQEYLAKFSQLIAFHDPQLTNHLDSIGFIPELYAIPWFLTMFSHVFPLHKIFHLWDKLLLGDSSFSLCIGLAILFQLRESLLLSGFNECILLFSDMPEINIERCVQESLDLYKNTPRSALKRKHEPPSCNKIGSLSEASRFDHYNSISNSNGLLDMSVMDNEALKMEPISLEELKQEKCPRISGQDFLQLLDLNGATYSHNNNNNHSSKFTGKMIAVDVRNREDYNRGAIPGSINIPYVSSFAQGGSQLLQSTEANILHGNKGKIIVVVGNRGDSAIKFSEYLLKEGFRWVCVLHRGIDIFRSSNILVVPSTL